jgi:serpin B
MPPAHRVLLAVLALALAACSDPTGPGRRGIPELPRPLTDAERAVIGASNGFAFSLLRQLNEQAPDSNLFISPLSASMALGMTMNGTAGQTQTEMRDVLGFGGTSLDEANTSYRSLIELLRGLDARVDFRIANSIWYEQSFPVEPAFLQTTTQYFDAAVEPSDFTDPSTVDAINDWVSTSTAGKIDRIIDDIPTDMVMYLINAIYFKGDWTTTFDPEDTRQASFAGLGGNSTVSLMEKTDSVAYTDINGTRIVELPYGGGAFAMSVVLPPDGMGINEFVADISAQQWNALHEAMVRQPVMIWLPKFTLEREYELSDALQTLGMRLAFGGGDFTPMSAAQGLELAISEVKHKTFVDVNEEGTEAAAVTSVGVIRVCACGPQYPIFRADRPFVFVIRERQSGTILFVGKIARL